jgi:hypothetical protein
MSWLSSSLQKAGELLESVDQKAAIKLKPKIGTVCSHYNDIITNSYWNGSESRPQKLKAEEKGAVRIEFMHLMNVVSSMGINAS